MGIYGESRIGLVRSLNEDSFYVSEDGTVMVVADGMGGYVGGEIASRTAVKSVAYYFSNYTHASTRPLLTPMTVLSVKSSSILLWKVWGQPYHSLVSLIQPPIGHMSETVEFTYTVRVC